MRPKNVVFERFGHTVIASINSSAQKISLRQLCWARSLTRVVLRTSLGHYAICCSLVQTFALFCGFFFPISSLISDLRSSFREICNWCAFRNTESGSNAWIMGVLLRRGIIFKGFKGSFCIHIAANSLQTTSICAILFFALFLKDHYDYIIWQHHVKQQYWKKKVRCGTLQIRC